MAGLRDDARDRLPRRVSARRGGALSLLLLAALQLGGEGVASRVVRARLPSVAAAPRAPARLSRLQLAGPRMVAIERTSAEADPNVLTKERPLKVLIAGAGIGGMLLANGLAKAGAEVRASACALRALKARVNAARAERVSERAAATAGRWRAMTWESICVCRLESASLSAAMAPGSAHELARASPVSWRVLSRARAPRRTARAHAPCARSRARLPLLARGAQVHIFERSDRLRVSGGPILIQSNALASIEAINRTIAREAMRVGTINACRVNGVKDGLNGKWHAHAERHPEHPPLLRGTARAPPARPPCPALLRVPPTLLAGRFCMFDTREPARRSGMPLTRVIKRQTLVELFQAGLAGRGDAAQLHFNKNLVDYTQKDGVVTARFADGSVEHGDVLVGADGLWSAVRSVLHGDGPISPEKLADRVRNAKYSGYACYEARCVFRPEEGAIVAYKVYIGRKKYFVLCDIGERAGGGIAETRAVAPSRLFGRWCALTPHARHARSHRSRRRAARLFGRWRALTPHARHARSRRSRRRAARYVSGNGMQEWYAFIYTRVGQGEGQDEYTQTLTDAFDGWHHEVRAWWRRRGRGEQATACRRRVLAPGLCWVRGAGRVQ